MKTNDPIPKDISILLLEDTQMMSDKMIKDLRDFGFTGAITLAENVSDAKSAFDKGGFDLIISDWVLPDGKGLDLINYVRLTHKNISIPLLVCTTIDDISNILLAIDAGASNYLIKPWTIEELDEKLNYAWSKHS